MGIPAKLLAEDEQVIIHVRTHWKTLAAPALVLVLAAAAAALVITLIPQTWEFRDWLVLAVIGAAVLLFLSAVLWPFLTWFTSTYTVTNRRIITRHGVITKSGRDIPLTRINDVSHERDLIDRILRCGTLVIWAASEQGKVVLYDVPRVEMIKAEIAQLLYAAPGGSGGGGDNRANPT